MAEGKKSFVLYCDMKHMVDLLDDPLAGRLFKHILSYVNDKNPETDDLLLKIAFEPIKQQLKRDLRDWEEEKFDRSSSGTLGNIARWHPDIYKQIIDKKITLDDAIILIKSHSDKSESGDVGGNPGIANIAVNVNATATDNVKVSDNGIHKEAAAAEIGSAKVKEVANRVWKDQIWAEGICQGLSITIPELKKWMSLFNSSVSSDNITDFNEGRYKRMCRGWISKQQAKGVTVETTGLVKKSDSAPLKRL